MHNNEIENGSGSGKVLFELFEKSNEQINLMPDQASDYLFILWNKGGVTTIEIDQSRFELNCNCMLFISEFHMEIQANFERVRIIRFSKAFLGIDTTLNQAGDYLLVFYGYHFLSGVPKIQLDSKQSLQFDQIWNDINAEYPNITHPVSAQLIRNSFQRMMLLAQKSHAIAEFDLPIDFMHLRTIREFQYLVETHFKELTKVSDYAQILMIPAKQIAELFRKHYKRKPTDLISHRRNLYA